MAVNRVIAVTENSLTLLRTTRKNWRMDGTEGDLWDKMGERVISEESPLDKMEELVAVMRVIVMKLEIHSP
jgi:hypothetical protein